MITVLVPAHNEEKIIQATIESLYDQTMKPSKVVIICDNCTDNTVNIAKIEAAHRKNLIIIETINNKHKKAGALNQVIEALRDQLSDFILIMDADTVLDKKCLEEGVRALKRDNKLGAVCSRAGILPCEEDGLWKNFLWTLQHLEYGSFDSHRIETQNKIKVAHGMCTMYRKEALMKVKEDRGVIYLEDSLVEDYELTLTLKYNWKVSTNMKMKAWTDVPLNLKELWLQRQRWTWGIESLISHGFTRVALPELCGHAMFILVVLLQCVITYDMINSLINGDNIGIGIAPLIILGITYVDALYRLKYVQDLTKWDVIIRMLFVPEMLYSLFQMCNTLYTYLMILFRVKKKW